MRYWVYMNGEVPGSYDCDQLAGLAGFTMTTLVCPAQGEVAEKNWRRAGEFDDIARTLSARVERPASPGPTMPPATETSSSADVDSMLDTASNRLFSHVADLMKELENRREERALSISLQRQISALKEELLQTRERADMLEMRLPRIVELEESHRKEHEAYQSLQAGLQSREAALNEARIANEKLKNELESTKRRLLETQNDLNMRNRLVDKLSHELGDKELSLAKSLGLIRRMEEDLNRLCPEGLPGAGVAAVKPPADREVSPPPLPADAKRAGEAAPPLPSSAEGPYSTDDPPPTPPYLEPNLDRPGAHRALTNLIKKVFPGQSH